MANRTGLTSFVNSQVGGSYVWGGTGNGGYDCSGLTYKAYESQGISIPRVAQDQYNASTKISASELQAGDLVFFSDTGSRNNVTHVGMYIGNGMYTHAANSSRGIVTDKLNTNGSYFVGAGTFAGTGGGSSILKPSQGGLTFQELQALGSSGGTSTGATVGGTSAGAVTLETVSDDLTWKQKIMEIVGHIVKVLTLILVFALAGVFFTKAFDIKIGKLGGII